MKSLFGQILWTFGDFFLITLVKANIYLNREKSTKKVEFVYPHRASLFALIQLGIDPRGLYRWDYKFFLDGDF